MSADDGTQHPPLTGARRARLVAIVVAGVAVGVVLLAATLATLTTWYMQIEW